MLNPDKEFTRLMKTHAGLVRSRVMKMKLLRHNERDEATQDVWEAVLVELRRRPERELESEAAFIRDIADKTLNDLIDKQQTKRRRHIAEPIADQGTSSSCLHRAYVVESNVEELLEREDTVDALVSLSASLRPDLARTLLAELNDDADDVTIHGHRKHQEMQRAARRLLGLPADYPEDADIADIKQHLFDAVDRIEAARAAALQESTCESDQASNPTNSATHPNRSGAMGAATSMSSESAPTLTHGSLRPRSASAHYRRRGAFRSRATRGFTKVPAVVRAQAPSRGRTRTPRAVMGRRAKGKLS